MSHGRGLDKDAQIAELIKKCEDFEKIFAVYDKEIKILEEQVKYYKSLVPAAKVEEELKGSSVFITGDFSDKPSPAVLSAEKKSSAAPLTLRGPTLYSAPVLPPKPKVATGNDTEPLSKEQIRQQRRRTAERGPSCF